MRATETTKSDKTTYIPSRHTSRPASSNRSRPRTEARPRLSSHPGSSSSTLTSNTSSGSTVNTKSSFHTGVGPPESGGGARQCDPPPNTPNYNSPEGFNCEFFLEILGRKSKKSDCFSSGAARREMHFPPYFQAYCTFYDT